MSRSAFGSIRRLPSGRYQARVTLEGRMTPLGTIRTRRDAVSAVAGATASPQAIEMSLTQVTLEEYCAEWWVTRAGHRVSTRARDRQVLNHDVLPVWEPAT